MLEPLKPFRVSNEAEQERLETCGRAGNVGFSAPPSHGASAARMLPRQRTRSPETLQGTSHLLSPAIQRAAALAEQILQLVKNGALMSFEG